MEDLVWKGNTVPFDVVHLHRNQFAIRRSTTYDDQDSLHKYTLRSGNYNHKIKIFVKENKYIYRTDNTNPKENEYLDFGAFCDKLENEFGLLAVVPHPLAHLSKIPTLDPNKISN